MLGGVEVALLSSCTADAVPSDDDSEVLKERLQKDLARAMGKSTVRVMLVAE